MKEIKLDNVRTKREAELTPEQLRAVTGKRRPFTILYKGEPISYSYGINGAEALGAFIYEGWECLEVIEGIWE